MKNYDVVIQAKITKTIRVFAEDEDSACELAHSQFSVLSDGCAEDYDQETLEVEENEKC